MVAEMGYRPSKKTGIVGIGIAALMAGGIQYAKPLIQRWEGISHEAYPDLRGVWTACYGETQGVHQGDVFTQKQCDVKLQNELHTRSRQILGLIPNRSVLSQHRLASLLSFQYNNGQGTLASTRSPEACEAMNRGRRIKHCHPDALIIYDLNRGDIEKSCNDFLAYDWAAGREIKGLKNRRMQESQICKINNP